MTHITYRLYPKCAFYWHWLTPTQIHSLLYIYSSIEYFLHSCKSTVKIIYCHIMWRHECSGKFTVGCVYKCGFLGSKWRWCEERRDLCCKSNRTLLWEKAGGFTSGVSFSPLQPNLIDVGRNCFKWEAGSVWDNRGFEEWSPAVRLWMKKKNSVVNKLASLPKERGKHFYSNNKSLKLRWTKVHF